MLGKCVGLPLYTYMYASLSKDSEKGWEEERAVQHKEGLYYHIHSQAIATDRKERADGDFPRPKAKPAACQSY